MADRYRTFQELAVNERLDIDYRICVADKGSSTVILAPHGGKIEPGTSEIAKAIAGDDLSFYAFEALTAGAHSDFHITSHRFDEPRALELVGNSVTSIAIHGRKNEGENALWLGGRDIALRDKIGASLRDAGFAAKLNHKLPGLDKSNICNRTLSGRGVQLEIPRLLRDQLAYTDDLMSAFSEAIRTSLPIASQLS